MAAEANANDLTQVVVLLAAGVAAVPVFKKIGLGSVLGYLAAGLAIAPSHIVVDGNDPPPGLSCDATAIVKGDALSLSIAAASIVAKVLRDRMMTRLAAFHPEYEFDRHVGYATPRHLAALEAHGPCRHHRMTFSPMRQGALAL